MNLVKAPDLLSEGEYRYLQNVRALVDGRISDRPTYGAAVYTLASPPTSIVRMNDTTPGGPGSGYVRVIGAGTRLYLNSTQVASGFSGNPLEILPFEPNQSVAPWAYIGDSSQAVTISATGQTCTGMVKVRSDGLTYKTGIKEPQLPPLVSVNTANVDQYLSLPANTPPWTNINGVNALYNYTGTDGQPPYPATIPTPIAGSTVTLTVTGTATVNGTPGTTPGASQPNSAGYPGQYITTPVTVLFAFTDTNGNVLVASTVGGAPPVLGNVGASATLTVPQGAAQLQIGIDSHGGSFSSNSGSYLVHAVISTQAIASVTALVGTIQAYIWGDSPHSGPVANYIWKNPNDVGTGISRTIGTAQAQSSNNSLILGNNSGGVQNDPQNGTGPVQWTTLNPNGSVAGVTSLFDPALESEGYQDFNCCILGSIFVPQGGKYAVSVTTKDQVMIGFGGGVSSDQQPVNGNYGQLISMASGLPLMYVSVPNGTGGAVTNTFHLNFPSLGVYQFELDWDYWYHSGRQLQVTMAATPGGSAVLIPPLPQAARTNVSYAVKYRSSKTGAPSNPGPSSSVEQVPVLANQVTSPYLTDPQADLADYYRQDIGLPNFTYVITGPNDGLGPLINGVQYNTYVEDTLTDLGAATNQQMQVDDFEPFPSIDTPKSGKVTIVDGVVTWKSGDQFNVRWLPGTLMLIGSPAQNAYVLTARPISTTQMVIADVPDTIGDTAGDGVPYNIAQPILAQQPMPSMWGPDAYGFMHACGDTNQPGAYLWTKAYNPDSAPQTNRLLLTSPSEALMGGDIVNGISMAFSTERAWLMYPNFADAQATVTGVSGNQWNPIPASVQKGLYIRNCLCSLGGRAITYRTSDGIAVTSGGPEKSLTDETLWPLFPHENSTPASVTVGAYTVYPPNDALPQSLTYQAGYIYWDYKDINSNPRTLVYDEKGKGWTVDASSPAFTAHSAEYAPGVNDTAVGLADNTVRVLSSSGTEAATSVVATGADDGGDARAAKRIADVFLRSIVAAASPVTVQAYSSQYANLLTGYTPGTLTGTGSLSPYIIDWGSNQPQDVTDIELLLSWATGHGNQLDLWQPSFMELPIGLLTRVTEGISHGFPGYQHVALLNLHYAATAPVTLSLKTDQGTVSVTFPAGGTLASPVKVVAKPAAQKFKVCSYVITSTQAWYMYDLESWVGSWGRDGSYEIFHPFSGSSPSQPTGVES